MIVSRQREDESGVKAKPLLIFINPQSGTKIASKLFDEYLKPDLQEQGVSFEVVVTEYAGHAKEIVKCRDLSCYSGVVAVSGDGLIFEVLNGLYTRNDGQRPDWQTVMLQTPLGVMPGGSGNALNCSLLRQLGQPLDGINGLGPQHSSRNVAIGAQNWRTTPLDIIKVETEDGKKVLSMFGVTIGLIADVDIGSEALRFLGYMRSYVLVMYRILFPRVYNVHISYLPLAKDSGGNPIPVSPDDEPLEMPSLNQSVPEGWVKESGNYFLMYALNLPMLDPLTLLAPDSSIGDGVIWLVTVNASMPRKEMIQWMLNTKDAAHVGKTGVNLVPVRAFRFEPVRPQGYLSVDGESFKFGKVQGQIFPGAAKIFTEK